MGHISYMCEGNVILIKLFNNLCQFKISLNNYKIQLKICLTDNAKYTMTLNQF